VRVAIEGAGTQFGGVHLPRIGQEVVVDFVDGDVDQPIIVGNVYNADTMPPWTLPDGKNICGAKTRSTPGGSSDNYNEMSFDDTTGSELVNMQAEKDSTALIKHDEKHTVGNDQFITVKNGVQITRILGGCDHVPSWGRSILDLNSGDQSTYVNRNRITAIMNDDTLLIEGGDQKITLDSGNQVTDVKRGTIQTTAMQSITLTVGQNSITIDQTGVTIKGLMITLNGSAMVQVKGGLVTIN
jgi:type VI secretion system secreted protein VgrG